MKKIPLKSWLEDNKIYFEVFQYTVLWVLWVLIGLSQAVSTLNQYKNENIQLQPNLKIYSDLSYNKEKSYFDTETLTIENEWGSLYELSKEITTFYKLSNFTWSYLIPVGNYFTNLIPSNNYVGVLLNATEPQNNYYYHKLYQEFIPHNGEYIDKFSILRLEYKNINKDTLIRYYYLQSWLWLELDEKDYYKYKNYKKVFENKYWTYKYNELSYWKINQFIKDTPSLQFK
jgi:hypothetical protein